MRQMSAFRVMSIPTIRTMILTLSMFPMIQKVSDNLPSTRCHCLCYYCCPEQSEQQPCIVCGGEHKFDGCPVLSDAKFLRAHCIRYCQHLRRDATARAEAFIGSAGEMPVKTTKKRIATKKTKKSGTNLVDTKANGSSPDDATDFQQGQT